MRGNDAMPSYGYAKMAETNRGHSHTPRKVELWDVAEDALDGLSANASGAKRRVDDWSILSTRKNMGFPKGWPGFYRHGEVLTRGDLFRFAADFGLGKKEAAAFFGWWLTPKFRRNLHRPLSIFRQGEKSSPHRGRVLSDKWNDLIGRFAPISGRGGRPGKTREFLKSEVEDIPALHSALTAGFRSLAESLRSGECAADRDSIMRWVCEKTKFQLSRVSPSPVRTLLRFGRELKAMLTEHPQLCRAEKSFQPARLASNLLALDYRSTAGRIEAVVAGAVQALDPRTLRQFILASPGEKVVRTRNKRGRGRPSKQSLFENATLLRMQPDRPSYSRIASILTPEAYKENGPRKSGEAIRRGVERLEKMQTKIAT